MSSLDRPLPPIRLILLMCGVEIFSMAGFAAYTTLLPALQREWALSNSEAGLIFGVVLDLAGGNRNLVGWGLAFASIGIFGALSPVARWFYRRRRVRDE